MSAITFGSVCSGIEAASVAWGPMGWRAAWLAEIEPFPCAVLAHHYPSVPNLGDMTKIATMIRDGYVAAPDVFCGGTPCQAFSVAGLRNSLDDARGNLSLIFCEIANEIDDRRAAAGLLPSVVFWENVPGVLNTKDNAFGCFLAGLAGEDDPLEPAGGKWTNAGCVFGPRRTVAWRVLDAQYFGVAQRRRRVFVVASARDGFDPVAVLFESAGVRRDFAPRRQAGQNVTGTISSRTTGGGGLGTDFELGGGFSQSNEVHCLAHGQGGAELAIERSPTLTCNHEAPIAFLPEQVVAGTLDTWCGEATQNTAVGGCLVLSVALRGREGGATAELGGDVAGTLRASGGGGGGDKAHVLAPVAYAIQAGALRTNPNSGPDGIGVQAHIAYTLEARAEVQAVCITGDVTHTLKAEGFDASEDETGRGQPIVAAFDTYNQNVTGEVTQTLCSRGDSPGGNAHLVPAVQSGMAVRRLTPRECERLQGFPDDHTAIPVKKVKRERLNSPRAGYTYREIDGEVWQLAADGPRYKALGNSWAVPNVAWIGRRIASQLDAHTGSVPLPIEENPTEAGR